MSDKADKFYDKYIGRAQGATGLDRVRQLLRLYDGSALDLLDIGCGNGELLALFRSHSPRIARSVGVDMGHAVTELLAARGLEGLSADAQERLPFEDDSFDVILAAEIIEHLFDTDTFVREIHRVLRAGGCLLLSTPNLAYLPNRVLLALGVQPLFTETSTIKHLGRWLPIFGQGHVTEGHTKIFTLGALKELLSLHGLQMERVLPYRFFPSGPAALIDSLFKARTTLAAGFAVRARKI